jgi:hypothetical protein
MKYLPYSNGKHMDELLYEYFIKNKNNIKTDMIYIPVYWSCFYYSRGYGSRINDLLLFLDRLDKSKKYFTVIAYDTGVYLRHLNLNLTLFSACGGGLNLPSKHLCEKNVIMEGQKRVVYMGPVGDYCIPLMGMPLIKHNNIKKSIFCSFVGRFNTHPCRIEMSKLLNKEKDFVLKTPMGFGPYKEILDASIFSLAPRGYGYTSFRLFEALLCESIPVFIWEDKIVLPYKDKINWNDICIIVEAKDMKDIPTILRNIPIEKRNKMVEKIREYNKKYFHFDYIYQYIVEKITQS